MNETGKGLAIVSGSEYLHPTITQDIALRGPRVKPSSLGDEN
jgi:hypothetical protein